MTRVPRLRVHGGGSPFEALLWGVVKTVAGCRAAAFIDQEGEAVDIAGYGDAYDVKVVGAHCNVLLHDADTLGKPVHQLLVGCGRKSFIAVRMAEGYSLVMILSARAAFHVSPRAIEHWTLELGKEAGFSLKAPRQRWRPVEVETASRLAKRPLRIRASDEWRKLQVLGALVGLKKSERGYRVRIDTGAELNLVREPLGHWWADGAIE